MKCIKPKCEGLPVLRPDHSTVMFDLYYCETCETTFRKPTFIGTLCGFAPSVLATCAIFGVFGGHGADHTTGWTDGSDSY